MSCIVYHKSKNGSTYAYRSESYRDPQTRKPRNRREYLGRVDPETGEIVPKRPRRAAAAAGGAATDARVAELEAELAASRSEAEALRRALADVLVGLGSLAGGAEGYWALCGGVCDGGEACG